MRVDTEGYDGDIHKTASVYTDDPETERFTIGIRAFVWVPISVEVSTVRLYGKEGAIVTKGVEIKAGLDKPLTLEPVRFDLEGKATYRIEEIERGKRFVVYVSNIPGAGDSFSGSLGLRTNYDEKPDITIRIRGSFTD